MNTVTKPAHAALLLRLGLGTMALAHGLLKLLIFTPAGAAGFFESLGLPGVLAYVTILVEVAGGVALITGFYARWVALGMVPILLGATWAHSSAGWLFSNEGGGWEFPLFWTLTLLVQALLGNGSFALRLPKRAA